MRAVRRVSVLIVAVFCFGPTPTFAGADAQKGGALFQTYCAGCHGPDGRGGAHTFMPHVDTLTKKGYIEQVPDEYLEYVILEGGAAVGKSSYMPSWKSKLKGKDVQDLIAFIRSFPSY